MKKLSIILILFLSWFSVCSQTFTEYEFYFEIKDRSELEKITQIISIDNVKGNTVYAWANEEEFEKFKALGYKYSLFTKERDSKYVIEMASTVGEMANWDKYPTYEVYCEMMQKFTTDYPSICMIDTIGLSEEGRHLLAVKISDNIKLDEAEPEFFYTSTMHGDETTGFILMLRLIDSLLTSYGNVSEITDLINNTEIYINPNANPDATYAGGNNSVSSSTRNNANGINLNRNFPDPDNGPHPDGYAWQAETVAMMDYARKRDFVLSANFHGGAEVANYPWDTWSRSHADEDWFFDVSTTYANSVQAKGSTGYFTDVRSSGVVNGYDWYVIAGGRQDYMLYYENCRELTIELSSVKLLSSDLLDAHWNYNKEALFLYIKEINTGLRGFVRDENGNPLEAMIYIENHDKDIDSSMVFSNPDHGDYYRLIKTGTYTVTASCEDYISVTKNDIDISDTDTTQLNFILKPKPTITFTGTVLNNESQNPVGNVQVTISGGINDTVYSDTDGKFTFLGLSDKNYEFRYSAPGYSSTYENLTLLEDSPNFTHELYSANIEDFESGNLQTYNWENTSDSAWLLTDTVSKSGTFSIISGDIDNSEYSSIELRLEIIKNSDIEFYKRVSSENYDALEFYIDNIKHAQWSGEQEWSKSAFKVEPGIHTFSWKYKKDNTGSAGFDCAWVDSILFPVIAKEKAQIVINPDTIKDSFTGANSGIKNIEITNQGKGILQFTSSIVNSENITWLSISNPKGTLGYEEAQQIQLNYILPDTDSTYSCEILIKDELNGTDTIIPVIFSVKKTVSINNIEKKQNIKVYPNPFVNHFYIELFLKENSKVNYQLLDLSGRILSKSKGKTYSKGNQIIKIDHLNKHNQVVILRLVINDEQYYHKLIQF